MSERYGYVIHSDDKFVIRMKQTGQSVELFIHRRENGNEMRPRGYWIGSNYLKFEVTP